MNKIIFIVEKTNTGFSAYAADDNIRASTSGDDISELNANILDAYNSFAKIKNLKPAVNTDIEIQLDLPQFFDYYKIINAKALGAKIGMSNTLISQYVNGHKKAGPKQVEKIMSGIKKVADELSSLSLSFS